MSIVSNVAQVLRHLETVREVSVSGIAAELGQPKSTASRLLKEMGAVGFLARSPGSRRYGPGPLLLSAGRHYKASFTLIDAAAAELGALVERFGHTGFVMGLERNRLIVLRTLPGSRPVRVHIPERLAGGLAFYRSGGRALLALLSDEEVAALYPRSVQPPASHSPQDLPALLVALGEIRERGFATSYDEAVPEVGGISVAVGPPDEEAVALNLSFAADLVGPAEREEMVGGLLRAADALRERVVSSAERHNEGD